GVEPIALGDRFQGLGCEVGRVPAGEPSVALAARSAYGVDDYGVGQGRSPPGCGGHQSAYRRQTDVSVNSVSPAAYRHHMRIAARACRPPCRSCCINVASPPEPADHRAGNVVAVTTKKASAASDHSLDPEAPPKDM